jgi:hypothetical protein
MSLNVPVLAPVASCAKRTVGKVMNNIMANINIAEKCLRPIFLKSSFFICFGFG